MDKQTFRDEVERIGFEVETTGEDVTGEPSIFAQTEGGEEVAWLGESDVDPARIYFAPQHIQSGTQTFDPSDVTVEGDRLVFGDVDGTARAPYDGDSGDISGRLTLGVDGPTIE